MTTNGVNNSRISDIMTTNGVNNSRISHIMTTNGVNNSRISHMIDHFEALVRRIKTGIAEMSEQQKHLKVFFTTDENLENI